METTNKRKQRTMPKKSVEIIVEREFTDKRTLAEAFIPVLYDAICGEREQARTIDNTPVGN